MYVLLSQYTKTHSELRGQGEAIIYTQHQSEIRNKLPQSYRLVIKDSTHSNNIESIT